MRLAVARLFVDVNEATDRAAGQTACQQSLAFPMEWLENTDPLMVKAAEYKALYPLSVADAWIAA